MRTPAIRFTHLMAANLCNRYFFVIVNGSSKIDENKGKKNEKDEI